MRNIIMYEITGFLLDLQKYESILHTTRDIL